MNYFMLGMYDGLMKSAEANQQGGGEIDWRRFLYPAAFGGLGGGALGGFLGLIRGHETDMLRKALSGALLGAGAGVGLSELSRLAYADVADHLREKQETPYELELAEIQSRADDIARGRAEGRIQGNEAGILIDQLIKQMGEVRRRRAKGKI